MPTQIFFSLLDPMMSFVNPKVHYFLNLCALYFVVPRLFYFRSLGGSYFVNPIIILLDLDVSFFGNPKTLYGLDLGLFSLNDLQVFFLYKHMDKHVFSPLLYGYSPFHFFRC